MKENRYDNEPENKAQFTARYDKFYGKMARLYDLLVKLLPIWKKWIGQAVPHIQGPRVLEISFGTGHLLTQYASRFETYGIDYNKELISIARKNLAQQGMSASLQRANVEALPYASETFDTLVNTMAFTAYPDGQKALAEMHRVLKKGGRLVLIDINYPQNGNWLGMRATRMWALLGDIIRDMDALLQRFDFAYTHHEIGGFGNVHLYIAQK